MLKFTQAAGFHSAATSEAALVLALPYVFNCFTTRPLKPQ